MPQQTQTYDLLRPMLTTCLVIGVGGTVASTFVGEWVQVATYAVLGAGSGAALQAVRRGHVRLAAHATVAGLTVLMASGAAVFGGYHGVAPGAWPAIILLSALLLGRGPAIATAAFAALHTTGLYFADQAGWQPIADIGGPERLFVQLAVLFAIADTTGRVLKRLTALVHDAQKHETVAVHALEERNDELERRKVTEAALQVAAREAKSANEAKSQFLASMSHELRTPLNAIIGYSEILLDDATDAEAAQDLGRIRGAGKHLLSLINDVLDLSKIEAGRMELALEDVALDALLADLVATVQPLVQQNDNRFVIDVHDGVGSLLADPLRVRQVLLNLLSNAAKFTKQGTVSLTVRRMEQHGREVVMFRVEDTGIGISAEQMARLFRAFVQADRSTHRTFGGTGLGLVLAKRFAEMMEGEVLAESTLGEGSIFTFLLPTRSAAGEVARLARRRLEQAATTSRPCILCVDDAPADLQLLDKLLHGEGFHPIPCADPRRALQLARSVQPAAILLDLHMPYKGGEELLADLKADEALRDVPVLMTSVDPHAATLVEQGALGWVPKPVDRQVLARIVQDATDSGVEPVPLTDTLERLRNDLELASS